MRTSTVIADHPDFSVKTVTCRDHDPDWSPEEPAGAYLFVLVRSGNFRIRSRGTTAHVDTTSGYWQVPSHEQQFAHPDGGDVCTSVTMSETLWEETTFRHQQHPDAPPTVRVDGRMELTHRLLLHATDTADVGFATAEQLIRLLAVSLAPADHGTVTPRSTADSRSLVELAREAILADHPAASGLLPLARFLETSPSHLSRSFSHDVGVSLTRYRNRVRVSRALARIDQGEHDLAALASDLGFADQAHFIRAARTETGQTPGAIRRLLAHA